MKYIKIVGYFNGNLGDDLMLKIILERYPNVHFYDAETYPDNLIEFINDNFTCLRKTPKFSYNNTFILSKLIKYLLYCLQKLMYIVHKKHMLKNTIATVRLGGSIFIEPQNESWDKKVERDLQRFGDNKLFIIGANFGPYTHKEFYHAYHKIFHDCNHVCFRDKTSYDLFKDLSNVSYAPDVVLNLKLPVVTSTKNNMVIISVINLSNRAELKAYAADYEQLIIETCIYSVQRGKIPCMVSFCRNQGDEDAINTIYSKLSADIQSHVKRLFYRNNLEEILSVISRSELILATRFHAMILAMVANIPFFCISYDTKIENYLKDVGSSLYVKLDEIKTINASQLLDKTYDYTPQGYDKYRIYADKQFEALDKFLKNY